MCFYRDPRLLLPKNKASPFFRLPIELRDQIYSLCILPKPPSQISPSLANPSGLDHWKILRLEDVQNSLPNICFISQLFLYDTARFILSTFRLELGSIALRNLPNLYLQNIKRIRLRLIAMPIRQADKRYQRRHGEKWDIRVPRALEARPWCEKTRKWMPALKDFELNDHF